jgi:hypothetical protein
MSHGPHVDAHDPFQKRVAVALALYTVVLAISNMLTSQAVSTAVIKSNETTGEWNYFQAKSNKQNIAEAELAILARLPKLPAGSPDDDIEAKLRTKIDRYEIEKAEIQKKAEALHHESEHSQHKAHFYEYAATIIELAIVIGGVSLLAASKRMLYGTTAIAAVSIALLAYTYFH